MPKQKGSSALLSASGSSTVRLSTTELPSPHHRTLHVKHNHLGNHTYLRGDGGTPMNGAYGFVHSQSVDTCGVHHWNKPNPSGWRDPTKLHEHQRGSRSRRRAQRCRRQRRLSMKEVFGVGYFESSSSFPITPDRLSISSALAEVPREEDATADVTSTLPRPHTSTSTRTSTTGNNAPNSTGGGAAKGGVSVVNFYQAPMHDSPTDGNSMQRPLRPTVHMVNGTRVTSIVRPAIECQPLSPSELGALWIPPLQQLHHRSSGVLNRQHQPSDVTAEGTGGAAAEDAVDRGNRANSCCGDEVAETLPPRPQTYASALQIKRLPSGRRALQGVPNLFIALPRSPIPSPINSDGEPAPLPFGHPPQCQQEQQLLMSTTSGRQPNQHQGQSPQTGDLTLPHPSLPSKSDTTSTSGHAHPQLSLEPCPCCSASESLTCMTMPTTNFVGLSSYHCRKAACPPQQRALNAFTAVEVLPGLFLGSYADATNVSALAHHDISLVIDVALECPITDEMAENRWGIRYLQFPFCDHSDEEIRRFFGTITSIIHEQLHRRKAFLDRCEAHSLKRALHGARSAATAPKEDQGNNSSVGSGGVLPLSCSISPGSPRAPDAEGDREDDNYHTCETCGLPQTVDPQDCGGVLVHCRMGVSRSASFILAYLILYGPMLATIEDTTSLFVEHFSAETEAVRVVQEWFGRHSNTAKSTPGVKASRSPNGVATGSFAKNATSFLLPESPVMTTGSELRPGSTGSTMTARSGHDDCLPDPTVLPRSSATLMKDSFYVAKGSALHPPSLTSLGCSPTFSSPVYVNTTGPITPASGSDTLTPLKKAAAHCWPCFTLRRAAAASIATPQQAQRQQPMPPIVSSAEMARNVLSSPAFHNIGGSPATISYTKSAYAIHAATLPVWNSCLATDSSSGSVMIHTPNTEALFEMVNVPSPTFPASEVGEYPGSQPPPSPTRQSCLAQSTTAPVPQGDGGAFSSCHPSTQCREGVDGHESAFTTAVSPSMNYHDAFRFLKRRKPDVNPNIGFVLALRELAGGGDFGCSTSTTTL